MRTGRAPGVSAGPVWRFKESFPEGRKGMFGVHLYALAKEEGSLETLLLKLKEAGYTSVEPTVVFNGPSALSAAGWDPQTFRKQVEVFARLGLEVSSLRVEASDCQECMPDLLSLVKSCGISQVVLTLSSSHLKETLEEFAQKCVRLAHALAGENAELLLRNEPGDLSEKIEGYSVLERVLDRCGGLVKLQFDTGSALEDGVDPESFLQQHFSLIRSVCVRDVRPERTAEGIWKSTALGQGLLDADACVRFALSHHCLQIVDPGDISSGNLEEACVSCALLKRLAAGYDHPVSFLEILNVETGERKVLKRFDTIIEAPNWSRDKKLIYNSAGLLYSFDLQTGEISPVNTGTCRNCNNDHVFSPDQRMLGVSCSPQDSYESQIFIVDLSDGSARQVTAKPYSFLHGWSPDGRMLSYCALGRQGNGIGGDICIIPAKGGEERRLTDGEGYNDGPEFSPDGKYIWFNSTRSGRMQIWRMRSDGTNPQQMTDTPYNDWFAHVSPDGEKVVYLSFYPDELRPEEHLPNKNVALWCMDAEGKNLRCLHRLFGGQGTINVNSWSPDSRWIAFVSYAGGTL